MEQFDPNQPYHYVGRNVQIGSGFGGMKPVAQSGTVTIGQDGTVALYGTDGGIIAKAPITAVTTKKVPFVGAQTVFVFFGDTRYSVTVNAVSGQIMSGDLYPGALGVFSSRQSTSEFVKTLDAVRGH